MLFRLVAMLISRGLARMAGSRALQIAGGAAVVADVVNLDWLRQESIKIAPGSDAAALEEAARTAARLLNLSGEEVLWPRSRSGEPISPNYLTIDLGRGRAWYHGKYYSRKSVSSARRPKLARPRGVARYR